MVIAQLVEARPLSTHFQHFDGSTLYTTPHQYTGQQQEARVHKQVCGWLPWRADRFTVTILMLCWQPARV